MARLRRQFEIQTDAAQQEIQKAEVIGGGGAGVNHLKSKNQNKLIISYCLPREVNEKRQRNLMMKARFLAKLKLLKQKGQALIILRNFDKWLNSKIDFFFNKCMEQLGKKSERIKKMWKLDELG